MVNFKFSNPWIQFMSETQIFSLSHTCVMLNNSPLPIFLIYVLYLTKLKFQFTFLNVLCLVR